MRQRKRYILLAAVTLALISYIGCGNREPTLPDESEGNTTYSAPLESEIITIGDRAELRAYTLPSSVFEEDDFIEAGWKKNKEYPLETLPEATAALFGFYNRKDIELRFYRSHEMAMDVGRESAEAAIKTEKISGRGAGFSSVTLYGAYLIAGNVVMLCEFSVQDCTDLLDEVMQ